MTSPAVLTSEPVRAYVYSVATAILVALVALGVIDAELGDVIGALVSAVLVVGATEKARSSVTPTA